MNALPIVIATLAALAVPALTLVPDPAGPLADPPVAADAQAQEEAEAGAAATAVARLVFHVQHAGADAPALLTFEGPSMTWAAPVVLTSGSNTVIDGEYAYGTYRITLQNVVTAGSMPVDLGACPHGSLAAMQTKMTATSFGLSVGPVTCLPAEG